MKTTMATVAIEESMNGSLREEVKLLRKKVVKLETAEADNERLRKEMSKLQTVHQDEKAQLELDFMNKLTDVARENALRVEEMEGRLSESNKVNRVLSEQQLADSQKEEAFNKKLNEIDTRHRKEIVTIVDQNRAERDDLHKQLKSLRESREKLSTKLIDAETALENKQKLVDSLNQSSSPVGGAGRESTSLRSLLEKSHEENARLKVEIQKNSKAAQDSRDELTTQLDDVKSELRDVSSELELKQKEVDLLKQASGAKPMQTLLRESTHENAAMERELRIIKESRDELTVRLGDAESALELKRKELEVLKQEAMEGGSETSAKPSMQKLLRKAHEDNAKLKSTIQHLETESSQKQKLHENEINAVKATRDIDVSVQTLEREKMELTNTLTWTEIENKRKDLAVKKLEREVGDLKAWNKKLETEKVSIQDSTITKLNNIADRTGSEESNSEVPTAAETSAQTTLYQKRTSQIIRQLEQNLKKEGQLKQSMTAGVKIRKLRSEAGSTRSKNVDAQSQEAPIMDVQEIQKQLEHERKLTATLKREVQELKELYNSVNGSETPQEVSTTIKGKSELNKEKNGGRVSGLAQRFERNISKQGVGMDDEPSNARRATIEGAIGASVTQLRSAFESSEIEELKDALEIERQSVLELEEELTRQCEINCSLLKEIGALSSETESSRNMNAKQFGNKWEADQGEKEKMSREIASLKSQLADAEQFTSSFTKKIKRHSPNDQKEIQNLQSELSKLKALLSEAEETNSKLSKELLKEMSSEKEEIERLKLKILELQKTLKTSEQAAKTMKDQCVLNEKALTKKHQLIEHLEKRLEARSVESNSQNARLGDLEKELSASKELFSSELQSKQHEIDGLNSLIDDLQSNLVDTDETRQTLQTEMESTERLQSQVQSLKQQLAEAEEKCEVLSKDQMSNLVDLEKAEESSGRLQSLVQGLEQKLSEAKEKEAVADEKCKTLAKELKTVSESRDELENNERTHHEKFDMLQAQVEEKVKQFEHTHGADKEAIGRLQEQVQSLQQELSDSLDQIEVLQDQLKQRAEVEETVEELALKNQHLYENKLQNVRVDQVMERDEYKKKIKGLEEMVESLQSEADARIGDKDREVEDLKRLMENKDTFIGRLTMEKDQLVLSMNDMTSSRRNEIDELQTELMEMSTRSANQAREVQSLKLQLEDSNFRAREVERLRARVAELGDEVRAKEGSQSQEHTALEVENSNLRQQLRQADSERQGVEEKLKQYIEEHKGGSSKSVQVLRERNAALKMEVEKLSRKLKKLYIAEHRRQSSESKKSLPSVESTRLAI